MKCIKIRGKKRQLCAGDLDRVIFILTRSIMPSVDIDYKMEFSDQKLAYAMITTENGVTIFDEVNIEQVISHYFYINYDVTVTSQNWIQFQDKYFSIVKVQDFDERHQFMLLYCKESIIDEVPRIPTQVGFGDGFGEFGGG